eukprot:PITA_24044
MVEEYDSIVRNSVWDVVPRPENKSFVSSRWLYKLNKVVDDSVEKHKARFVARGFSQVEGINYDETFSPVARYSPTRSMLALSTQMGWKIHQMDVKTAFLNDKIEEEVYIKQAEGFETFDCYDQLIMSCKEDLAREFEMKDMGLMHYFLGMEVWQKDGELFVSQGKYANEILRRFHMEKCKPMQTPLASNWRKEAATLGEVVEAIVYQQLVGLLIQTEGVKIQGFTDADWAGSPLDQKSTSAGIFNLGSAAVSWYSKKQRSVALSLVEVEYMVAS